MTNATQTTVAAAQATTEELNILLAAIKRSGTEQTQVAIKSFKGKKYLDIRTFYTTDEGKSWLPTKKGITISPKNLLQLRDAIDKAIDKLLTEEETK